MAQGSPWGVTWLPLTAAKVSALITATDKMIADHRPKHDAG
jgi:hypothetical protein